MRIPLSWLKEYIHLDNSPDEIAHQLTMAGLEVDHIETIGENLSEIVVVTVLEANKHPNADKLTIASVTDGNNTYQVVCGAPNCRQGLKTAFAKVGTELKDGTERFTIKKAKIRGIESEGMLCSGKELGLSADHDGILEIDSEVVNGSTLKALFADTFFEISLTPNLSHCTSIYGIARELSAITGKPLKPLTIAVNQSEESIDDYLSVQIEDKENCPRYSCRVIRNVQIAPSPQWLKERIEKCGLRSVNNVVDITNYVLLELGHPIHAFDYDRLEEQAIVVRKARSSETIQTLDGKERKLSDSQLMICDRVRPVAIAGIMGGANSEVNENTKHIVLECAYFDPMSIRRTSKHLNLSTDASKRFERGTDPNHLIAVLNRASMLIQQVSGGKVLAGCMDCQAKEFPQMRLSCRLARINQMIGRTFSRGEVEEVFGRLHFSFHWDGQDQFAVTVPTYRNDIKSEIDLVEEVARLYGYDNIPRKAKKYDGSSLPSIPLFNFERQIREKLIGEGLQEFLTCDLIGPTLLQIIYKENAIEKNVVKVLNPTSIEQSILRISLLPGLLQVVKYNHDHNNQTINGFEIGRIHFRENDLYKEQPVVGMILSGNASLPHWGHKEVEFDFFDLKGIVENLLASLKIENYALKNIGLETFHSGRQASIYIDSMEIGSFGEIHPAIQRRLDVPQRIFFAEFNLQPLMQLTKPLEKVTPLSIYPASERDWTLTIHESVPYANILKVIEQQHSSILESVSLKDIYKNEKLGVGNQNITLHFVYRDLSKTIEQEVVDQEHERLTNAVRNQIPSP